MKDATKIIITLGALLLGVALGFLAGVYYQTRSTQIALALLSGKIIVAEADHLERIYKSGDPEQTRHALEHFAHVSEMTKTEASFFVGEDVVDRDLAFTYARLGLLHKESGDAQKASQYFERAVEHFPAHDGQKLSADEIVRQVLVLDRALTK